MQYPLCCQGNGHVGWLSAYGVSTRKGGQKDGVPSISSWTWVYKLSVQAGLRSGTNILNCDFGIHL